MDKKTGFAFFIPWSIREKGGVNNVVLNLAKEMKSTSFLSPIIFCSDWDCTSPVISEYEGIIFFKYKFMKLPNKSYPTSFIKFTFWLFISFFHFYKIFNTYNIRVVNFHYPDETSFSIVTFLKLFIPKIRLIFSFHGSDVNTIAKLSTNEKSQWLYYINKVDNNVACSVDLANKLKESINSLLKVDVVYNGVKEFPVYSCVDNPLGANCKFILNIGKYISLKGQQELLEAFHTISKIKPNYCLVFIGSNGPELKNLKEMTHKFGLASRVFFLIDLRQEEIAYYYENASMFVLPSHNEGFPLVLLEAGMFNLPVIATNVGGIPELIKHKFSGLLVNAYVPSELADAIIYLINDKEFSTSLARNLFLDVSNNYSWSKTLKNYIKLMGFKGG